MNFDYKVSCKRFLKRTLMPLRRLRFNELEKQNGIRYIHRHPVVFNIGDYLCSPRHYFDFEGSIESLIITGGGIYTDRDLGYLSSLGYPLDKMILWGAGESLREETLFEQTNHNELLNWGRRDIARVESQSRFLPCVSCLLSFLSEPCSGEGTLLLLNADPEVTNSSISKEIERLARERSWRLLWNSCSPEDLRSAYLSCDTVITNSFHASYWGLLSGKHVKILGYSSKFESLRYCLGLSEDVVLRHQKGSTGFLLSVLKSDKLMENMAYLPNFREKLKEFRQLNLRFAQRLLEEQIIGGYQLVDLFENLKRD